MNRGIRLLRAGAAIIALLNVAGAYVALHGLPAAILVNDNPTQNVDVFFWSVLQAIVWGGALVYLGKVRPKAAPPASDKAS